MSKTLSPLATAGLLALAFLLAGTVAAKEPETAAERGYRWLTQKSYLPADFTQEVFDQAWTEWPEPLRSQAEKATPEERRAMAFSRYGLTPRPDDPTKPLQYVVDDKGVWTMNCFACHGGQVEGKVIPGLPNSRFALQTLTDDTRAYKLNHGKSLGRMDLGSLFVPLGTTNGTTNAVMFGVALMNFRDPDLSVHKDRLPPRMVHHDMDAPPWWHFQKKDFLYADAFAGKGHRGLMQFMMVPQNGPAKFHEWEADYRDVYAYISSIEPPKYPHAIDAPLAEKGRLAFNRVCSDCHGTYGRNKDEADNWPAKVIPLSELKTDPVRLQALSPAQRNAYGSSWFTDFGKIPNVNEPKGYVAQPLDGIWASAPYLHNGSVPTLWHMLHPSERPKIWKRTETGYDQKRVGLEVETFDALPASLSAAQTREHFHTERFGKSAAGHDYPDALSEDEKTAVLEYLKTL
ncbi:cytochrome c [Anatilimnocola sp. NA78]|uniref:c-type cytochrome n=1 Tax=Anatilimnocola sp. NA78 TaxID=3415683 RepID=UPI003CE46862